MIPTFFADLAGPALCVNFGPSLELGVNEVVVPLLLVCFRVFIYKSSSLGPLLGPDSFYFIVSGLAPPSGDTLVCDIKRSTSTFVDSLPSPSVVVAFPDLAKIKQILFFDSTFFRAGEIHNHLPVWERMLIGHSLSQLNFINIVREGVRIDCFIKPFKGNFRGCSYDAPLPPSIQLNNFKICEKISNLRTSSPTLCLTGYPPGYLCGVGLVR